MNKKAVTCSLFAGFAGALALASASCSSDSGGTTTADAPPSVDAPVISGTYTHYVTSEVHVGDTTHPASGYAFDLDGNGTRDNRLGTLLATFNNTVGLEATINGQLQSGEFVILHSLKSSSFTTAAAASWQVYLGTPFTDSQQDAGMFPKFDGTGSFTIKSGTPTDAITIGSVAGGTFTGGPGNISLQIAITSGPPVTINLVGARIEADVAATGCMNGKVGGGIPYTDLVANVFPAIAADLDARLDANGCRADLTNHLCDDTQKLILGAIDQPAGAGDRHITVSDLSDPGGLVGAATVPDVDLIDGVDNPVPGQTNTHAESVSIGLGFSCVNATFTASNEQ
jgi:hypothetical protein